MFYSQTVSVETFTGPGETGDTYAAAQNVVGFLDDGLRLTDSERNGDVVESVSVFYCPLSWASKFVPESRVTVPSGAVMQVTTVKRRQASPIFANVAHLEVRLT
jgi:hypothetical protein